MRQNKTLYQPLRVYVISKSFIHHYYMEFTLHYMMKQRIKYFNKKLIYGLKKTAIMGGNLFQVEAT